MSRLQELSALAETAANCRDCGLHAERIKSVFSRGNPEARLMFVAEAPGREENEQGLVFVGDCGKKLDSMLTSLGIEPNQDAYFCNTVKCWPPGNRLPTPEETATCAPYLWQQIELINPKVVVSLGNQAARSLLGKVSGINSIRGRTYQLNRSLLVPTFHPSYILRGTPGAEEKMIADLALAVSLVKSE